METLINRCPSKSYMDNSIVCDKCGKTIIRDDVYGYGHACSVNLKEINQRIDNMYNPYAATPEERRIRRDLRDYANALYNPEPLFSSRDYPKRLS